MEILYGYLYIVKNFLEQIGIDENIFLYQDVNYLICQTDFSKLFDEKSKLFSIGFNLEENKLTNSYYDFLASEARQASLVAIAKKNIPVKHWNSLSRTITIYKNYKGLISWTGTAFEYLMPNLNLKRYSGSLLDESSKFAILSQKEYCKKLKIPWGISESAYNRKDLNYNYQYKAFGIPWLGLKRGLEDDLVVSPYSTFLALQEGEISAISNLKNLEKLGGLGQYGFFEAIDFTGSRLKKDEKYAIIKTYMAHHQGLILNSINEYINNDILQKRFNNNPEIEAVQILLQERMPLDYIITKEKKQKPEKPKIINESGYIETYLQNNSKDNLKYHVISNGNYKVIINTNLGGYSEYKNYLINKYKPNYELEQGIKISLKSLKTGRDIPLNFSDLVIFSQDKAEFITKSGGLSVKLRIMLNPNKAVEIRRLELENISSADEILEVSINFIPILSERAQEYAHPVFNDLFLNISKEEEILVERHNRELNKFLYLATTLYTENANKVDNSFELKNGIYQKQVFKLDSGQKTTTTLLLSVSEIKDEALNNLKEMKSENNILKNIEVSKIRSEEEMNYLQISPKDAKNFYDFLTFVLEEGITKNLQIDINKQMEMNCLWKFGISGDLPIVVVKAKNLEDTDNLQEVIECFLYLRMKQIYLDLIIFNEESNVYERFVKDTIDGIMFEKQIDYLRNSGIYILNCNEIEKEDLDLIELKAKIVLDASKRWNRRIY